eukprot:10848772-Ditylum_brightwellii.AAC.1
MDNNTVCSDDNNDTTSNNDNDNSKTDQMEKTAPSTFSSTILYNNKQQKNKNEVIHKELLATFPSQPAVPMIALTFSVMLKSEFSKLASGHLSISSCMFNLGTMTTEVRQVEVGNSPTHLPVSNVPMHARPKDPYVTIKNHTSNVLRPYAVTSTPTKIETQIKTSVE